MSANIVVIAAIAPPAQPDFIACQLGSGIACVHQHCYVGEVQHSDRMWYQVQTSLCHIHIALKFCNTSISFALFIIVEVQKVQSWLSLLPSSDSRHNVLKLSFLQSRVLVQSPSNSSQQSSRRRRQMRSAVIGTVISRDGNHTSPSASPSLELDRTRRRSLDNDQPSLQSSRSASLRGSYTNRTRQSSNGSAMVGHPFSVALGIFCSAALFGKLSYFA